MRRLTVLVLAPTAIAMGLMAVAAVMLGILQTGGVN